MLDSSEFWLIVLVLIVIIGACVRWIIYKTTGKQIDNGDGSLITALRTKLVKALIAGNALISIEREHGREAVRGSIALRIRAYVEETDMFTRDEKTFIEALNIDWLVDLVEKELIKLNVLKP